MDYKELTNRTMFRTERLNERLFAASAIIIYGAGYNGISALIALRDNGLDAASFCDGSEKKQGRLCGIPVVSPDGLAEYPKDACVIISPEFHIAQIKDTLVKLGFDNIVYFHDYGIAYEKESAIRLKLLRETGANILADNAAKIDFVASRLSDEKSRRVFHAVINAQFKGEFAALGEYMEPDQYFPKDIIKLGSNEVFVDCGALNGDSIYQFVKRAPDYAWIYAFEPEPIQYELTKALIEAKNYTGCIAYPLGVSSGKQELRFSSDGGSSRIDDKGETTINVDSLDNLLYDEPHRPTYIKMDIEGAELLALKGAEKLFERDHPRMAISVYHKPEDIWELPNYIFTAHPGYEVFLRQHAVFTETVMYALWAEEVCRDA